MNDERKIQLLELLDMARKTVENGQEISTEYARVLFPPERREYELTYYGKESKEQIISQTFAAPLQEDRRFGKAEQGEWINKLIFGDNLQVLKCLAEMKKEGNLKNADGTDGVRLVYIDPPFASRQDFSNDEKAYSDKIKGAQFLEWLRKRLVLIREVLADNGAVFVHLDWLKVHYIKVLLDEVFGEGNFRNEIIWHYGTYVGNTKNNFPRKHDSILVYGKSNEERIFFPQRDGVPENDANYKRWTAYFNENNMFFTEAFIEKIEDLYDIVEPIIEYELMLCKGQEDIANAFIRYKKYDQLIDNIIVIYDRLTMIKNEIKHDLEDN